MSRTFCSLAFSILLFCSSCSSAQIAHITGGCSVKGTTSSISSGAFNFTCTPNATNDAIIFEVTCSSTSTPGAVSLSASGWTITAISGLQGSTTAGWVGSFAAIAPSASATTFTATFTGGGTCGGTPYGDWKADEFSGNDTTGGVTTFDAHNQATGSGNCSVSVTPANNNDAVWGVCEDSTTALGSGYTQGQNDGGGDWTEYKILSGGSGVAQTVNFTGSGAYNALALTIKPAEGATAPAGFQKRLKLEKLDALY